MVHLNCHSMPAVASAFSTDFPWMQHADFVLDDRDGSTAHPALTRWMERLLASRGYTVSVNHPYKGVELVRLHGRPQQGRHSIQIEINKAAVHERDDAGDPRWIRATAAHAARADRSAGRLER